MGYIQMHYERVQKANQIRQHNWRGYPDTLRTRSEGKPDQATKNWRGRPRRNCREKIVLLEARDFV